MKRKFYSVLYVAIFALLMSGCSMSEIADGSRSAVKGYEKETVEDTSTRNFVQNKTYLLKSTLVLLSEAVILFA